MGDMAKAKIGRRKDQKKRSQGTSPTGKTNQYRGRRRGAVGSSTPGSNERGKKKWTKG
jgi:hypothetical protein